MHTHMHTQGLERHQAGAAACGRVIVLSGRRVSRYQSLLFPPLHPPSPPRPPPSQGDLADPSVCVRDTGPRIGDTSCRQCSRADAAQGRTAGGPSAAPRRQRVNNHMQIARSVWPSAHANAACRSGVCVCLCVFTKRGAAVVGGGGGNHRLFGKYSYSS